MLIDEYTDRWAFIHNLRQMVLASKTYIIIKILEFDFLKFLKEQRGKYK